MGPYRTRLNAPETHDDFWKPLERRRAMLRRLPRLVFALASLPALAVAASGVWQSESHSEAPTLERAFGPAWGLGVTPSATHLRNGATPNAPRPDATASTTSADQLQSLIQRHASARLSQCYASALEYEPELAGDVVVSIAVSRQGEVRSVLGGARALRRSIGSCVESALRAVPFPVDPGGASWFHYPIRFSPS